MNNKFAAALKAKSKNTEEVDDAAEIDSRIERKPHTRPSRKATKHIGGYYDPLVSRQIREIALVEDSSVQALLGEAIDMLFQSRQKPMIASRK